MRPRLNFNGGGDLTVRTLRSNPISLLKPNLVRKPLSAFLLFILMSGLMICSPVLARAVPPLTGPVVDEVGLLDGRDIGQLSAALMQLRREQGPQIQVLIINSLEGEPLEEYSIKVVDQWKLGDERKDDGLLYLIVVEDRKMRIEAGQGLEGDLPDITAGRILRQVGPYFKKGLYRDGIFFAVNSIVHHLGFELKDVPQAPPPSRVTYNVSLWQLLVFFVFFMFLFLFGNRSSRGWRSRSSPFWYGGGGWGGDGRGGWGGGGGSWGGGGGGFSGGGASGDW